MRIEQLKGLIAVEKHGSINKAAQSLYISYQSLLASLNALEEELGYKVLNRTAHGVVMTEVGKRIVDDAKEIVAKTERWFDPEFRQIRNMVEINIACTALMRDVLDRLILQTRKQYPQIKFKITKIDADNKELSTVHLKSDYVILAIPSQKQDSFVENAKMVQFEVLGYDHWGIIFNQNNPLQQQDVVAEEQLQQYNWANYAAHDIVFPEGHALGNAIREMTVYNSDDKKQMLEMVANSDDVISFGVGLDRHINEAFKDGRLSMRPLRSDDDAAYHVVYLLGVGKKELSSAEEYFLEQLRGYFHELRMQNIIT